MLKNQGALVISLDFELIWGVFDKVRIEEKKEYFSNTLEVIPKILNLFEQNQISATWATVGMLLNHNWDEWNSNIPNILPNYQNSNLSPYQYGKQNQRLENEKYFFAPDLVSIINEALGQEVGTHTYSHYYCLEKGQDLNSFKEDIELALVLNKKFGIELKSLVFPRNQLNKDYLEVCGALGIKNIRSNPDVWYWDNTQKDTLKNKVFRTGDAYFGFRNKSYLFQEEKFYKSGYNLQKASRLLRPHGSTAILNKLKIKRIISEMEKAAKNNEVYHLWWHPHNFGNTPEENLKELELILNYFKLLKNKYGFKSMNMNDLSSGLISS